MTSKNSDRTITNTIVPNLHCNEFGCRCEIQDCISETHGGLTSPIVSIVFGLIAMLSSLARADGIGIDEIVEVYNHNNYEFLNYLMFNNRSFMAQLLEEVNQKMSGIQRMQMIAFAIGLLVVLIQEVKA